MAVLRPLKLIIDNYPEGQSETLIAENHPQKPEMGTREITFSKELWIEETDFAEVPPKGFRRLTLPTEDKPAKPVRLRYGYVIIPTSCDKDENGRVIAVHANYLPETKSGTEGAVLVKAKATIHWLDVRSAEQAEFRLYDRLFSVPHPEEDGGCFLDKLNPNSKNVLHGYVEANLAFTHPGCRYQFERLGYFVADIKDCSNQSMVFNRSVELR